MEQMTYENYVQRITTKGMRWRAVDQSPDMKRFVRAQATIEAGGRKLEASAGALEKRCLITIDSLPERQMEVPKLEDLPEELRELLGKIENKIGAQLARLKAQKRPAKFLAVEVHPQDIDRDDPRLCAESKVSSDVLPKKLFLAVQDQPDHWRMRHDDNRDAWVEFEFLGPIELPANDDDDKGEAAISDEAKDAAGELLKRLGDSATKH